MDIESSRDPVEELAAEFIERLRVGEEPSIESYVEKYPDLADGILDLFPTIISLEQMKHQREKDLARTATARPLRLKELGDFKVLREIGRGGMGIVYEAEQESLGRRVALKVLPKTALLDTNQLERFQQEAQIAARLHHTNVVSLHGVGEQDGYHFLVMELIEGASLDKVIPMVQEKLNGTGPSERKSSDVDDAEAVALKLLQPMTDASERNVSKKLPPSNSKPIPQRKRDYFRNVAKMGCDAAGALQYAFERGVVHRDIKPANLLLGPDNNIFISDFGLARRLGEGSVTQTVYGTLAYMPPEGFEGKLDARSDVYSLGLSLYEALTFERAFEDRIPGDALKRLAGSKFNFKRPREIDPSIPRDLETIVLKAAAKEPRKRYASAEEMSEDLQRYLDNRPITARRTSTAEHVWRWCERNKAVASLAGLALASLALVAIVMTASFFFVRQSHQDVRKSLERESRLRERSEESLKVAAGVLDGIYEQVVPGDLINYDESGFVNRLESDAGEAEDAESNRERAIATLSPDTASLLENLLTFYDRLAEQSDGNPELQESSTKSISRIGDIYRQLGQREKALEHYATALKRLDSLQLKHRRHAGFFVESARIYNQIGRMEFNAENYGTAKDKFHSALAMLIQGKIENDPLAKYEEAKSHYCIGCRKPFSASKVATEQLSMRRRPSGQGPGQRPRPNSRPPRRPDRQQGFETKDEFEYRLGHLNKAIEILDEQPDEFKQSPNFKLLLACCYREMGSGDGEEIKPTAANRATAVKLLDALVQQYPDNPHYRLELVKTLQHDVHGPPGSELDAKNYESVNAALRNVDLLVTQHPQVPHYGMARMHVLHKLGHSFIRTARFAKNEERFFLLEEAERSLGKAKDQINTLCQQWPKVTEYQLWSVVVDGSLAKAEFEIGDSKKSHETLASAIGSLHEVSQANTFDANLQTHLQTLRRALWEIAKESNAGDLVEEIESSIEWKLDPETESAG